MTDTFELNEILEAFKRHDGAYKQAEVQAAVERKEEITPYLLRILENTLANPHAYIEDKDAFDHIYALMLLGHFKETAAHRLIVDLFGLPPDIPDQLFGEVGLCNLPVILVSTCGGYIEKIKALAENRNADTHVRTSALNALAFAVAEGIAEREDVLAFYEKLFVRDEAEDTSDFWSLMAMFAVDLFPVEIMDTINQAYENELIHPGMIRYEDFENSLAEGPEKGLERLRREYRQFLLEDIHREMSGWACFRPVSEKRRGSPNHDQSVVPLKNDNNKASVKKKKAARRKRKMAKASKKKNRR
ncbi:MAG: DUF1186 family protein [Desulfobacteraceae bacterium]|nr:DUF1186 family protein [Desulfobacteraceae bacterium]